MNSKVHGCQSVQHSLLLPSLFSVYYFRPVVGVHRRRCYHVDLKDQRSTIILSPETTNMKDQRSKMNYSTIPKDHGSTSILFRKIKDHNSPALPVSAALLASCRRPWAFRLTVKIEIIDKDQRSNTDLNVVDESEAVIGCVEAGTLLDRLQYSSCTNTSIK